MEIQLKRKMNGKIVVLYIAVAICASAALLLAQSNGIITKDQKAKEAVDASLKAISGADKIGDIRSLVLKGTLNLLTNKNTLSSGFEIRILLPDSFVEISWLLPLNQHSGIRDYSGVSQGILIPPPPSTKPPGYDVYRTPNGEMAKFTPSQLESFDKNAVINNNYNINTSLDWWACFLFGTLMKIGPTPLTISSNSEIGVFTLAKSNDTWGEIEFDSKNSYPSVVRYKRPEHPIMPPSEIFSKLIVEYPIFRERLASDIEMRFQDRFPVNGVMFPRVITIIVSTVEHVNEFQIEEVQINPKLSLKDFEIPEK